MNDSVSLLDCWKLVKLASADPRLARGDVAVLMAILDYMNSDGVAWPSIATIAKAAKSARRSAARSVAKLTDTGYLIRESGDRTRSNRYRMGALRSDEPVTTGSDELVTRGSDEAVTGVVTVLSGEVVTNLSPELALLNLPIEPAQEHTDRFAEFYAAFPRKEARPAAEKAWRKQKLDPLTDVIVADVLARMQDGGPWKGTEKRFIPLPATYLNHQRWQDEWQPAGSSRVGAIPVDERTAAEIDEANARELARFGMGAPA